MSSKEKSDKSKHADTIIRNHIVFSMGASFIPFPIADMLAVSALQLDMIRQLCRVYDIDFSETQGKAIITALSGPILAKQVLEASSNWYLHWYFNRGGYHFHF